MSKHQTQSNSATPGNPVTKDKKNRKQPQSKLRKFLKISMITAIVLFVLAGGAGAGYVAKIIRTTPKFNIHSFTDLSASSIMYDRNGSVIGTMDQEGNRELIKSVKDVSPYLKNAFIAGEDKDFYHHIGINPLALARAAFQDLIGHKIMSGASTITQQTVKLVMFPLQQQTIQRKIQEVVLALQLEREMTKDEILTTYMNWIYFGQSSSLTNLYGVKSASKAIFDVTPDHLNLAQAAFLAAIPNNPSYYSPFLHPDHTIERQHYILDQMLADGLITKADYSAAMNFDVKASMKHSKQVAAMKDPFVFEHAVSDVVDILKQKEHLDTTDQARQLLDRGGFKIYTTIDGKLQQDVDQVFNNDKNFWPPISYSYKDAQGKTQELKNVLEQAGATLIDNKTGEILAMGGGRDFQHDQNDHTVLPRQPGSSIKPLGDYGPAINEKVLSPASVIDDVPMQWSDPNSPNGKYFPMNWDHKFHGLLTAREALVQSYNIPAIKVLQKITPQVGMGYVEKMGITTLTKSDKENLSSAIGGLSQGLEVQQETGAYTTFPNNGVWHKPYMITKIVDLNGHTIYENKPETREIFSPQASWLTTNMMQDVVKRGTASIVGNHFPGKPIAGKTGTTDDDKDAWFVGFTPKFSLGIWVGYDIPHTLTNPAVGMYEGHRPLNLWNDIMDKVFAQYPNQGTFKRPDGLVQMEVSNKSGLLPTALVKETHSVTTDWFIKGTEPTKPDDVLVQAKYVKVAGKYYLPTDQTPAQEIKTGIFIKRKVPYVLPDNNPAYLPQDSLPELPTQPDPRGGNILSTAANVPDGLHVDKSGDHQVALSWAAVNQADGYILMRSQSPTGPFQMIGPKEIKDTTYTDSDVQQGKTYYYQISSVDASGTSSDPSKPIQVTIGAASSASNGSAGDTGSGSSSLSAPSNLEVTPAGAGFSLSWSNVSGATSYVIYRAADAIGPFSSIGSVQGTTFTDGSANANLKYYYQVTAKNDSGESGPSTTVAASTSASSQTTTNTSAANLVPPANIQAKNLHNGSSVTISWSSNGAAHYLIERSLDNKGWGKVAETSASPYTDTGLTSGTTYYYRVSAIDSAGNVSDPGNPVSVVPGP
ncbi:transglycosylase domain-containing protein [Fodinisporobacter ferrooxydans]|uniref:Transglycosylase domain-containing protein n=1 Tax=Fodinisporobacter ferrooxydans TaxID=2901836 RepID=A0ABY4CXS5_9BACL|nr:transglycosylase domain-containing protein [Alicyclobacillaceae bacterium MYW30-H2]